MGVVAMKTLKGAKHNGLRGLPRARRGLLPGRAQVGALEPGRLLRGDLVLRVPARRRVPARVGRQARRRTDVAILDEYDRQIAGTYCAPALRRLPRRAAPSSSPIHDVLRYRMYFEDYGDEKEAMRLYAALEKNASVCASCSAPCLGSCPIGIADPGPHDAAPTSC